jgi:pyrophosphatase PpaX
VHDELICEYPGTEQALQALSDAGYRMGIVTSKSRPVAQRGIDRFELGRFFEVIVAFEDTTVHKPEAAPLLLAAEQLGVASDRCLYCGDSPHDMACGIAAGSLTAAALWGPFPERVLEPGPDYAIDSLSRLAALLGGDEREYRVSGH